MQPLLPGRRSSLMAVNIASVSFFAKERRDAQHSDPGLATKTKFPISFSSMSDHKPKKENEHECSGYRSNRKDWSKGDSGAFTARPPCDGSGPQSVEGPEPQERERRDERSERLKTNRRSPEGY